MTVYYLHSSGIPISQSRGASPVVRNEFDLIQSGFASVASDIATLSAAVGTPTALVETDVASASTTTIGAASGSVLRITGTTAITSFGVTYAGPKFLRFQGALTLTNGAGLVLPGGANITTTAGDTCIAVPIGNPASGWRVESYTRMTVFPSIQFPATQAASSDPNTLDDYEEGTWTPTFSSAGGTFNYAAGGQVGLYTKIGNVVTFSCLLQLATSGNTLLGNQVVIAGLPFASASPAGRWSVGTVELVSFATPVYGVIWDIGASISLIGLRKITASATSPHAQLLANDLHATAGTSLWFSGQYTTA